MYEACKDIVEGAELLVWYGDSYLQFVGVPICLKEAQNAVNNSEAESESKLCNFISSTTASAKLRTSRHRGFQPVRAHAPRFGFTGDVGVEPLVLFYWQYKMENMRNLET